MSGYVYVKGGQMVVRDARATQGTVEVVCLCRHIRIIGRCGSLGTNRLSFELRPALRHGGPPSGAVSSNEGADREKVPYGEPQRNPPAERSRDDSQHLVRHWRGDFDPVGQRVGVPNGLDRDV